MPFPWPSRKAQAAADSQECVLISKKVKAQVKYLVVHLVENNNQEKAKDKEKRKKISLSRTSNKQEHGRPTNTVISSLWGK